MANATSKRNECLGKGSLYETLGSSLELVSLQKSQIPMQGLQGKNSPRFRDKPCNSASNRKKAKGQSRPQLEQSRATPRLLEAFYPGV
jgi:hypothetical protein